MTVVQIVESDIKFEFKTREQALRVLASMIRYGYEVTIEEKVK